MLIKVFNIFINSFHCFEKVVNSILSLIILQQSGKEYHLITSDFDSSREQTDHLITFPSLYSITRFFSDSMNNYVRNKTGMLDNSMLEQLIVK